MCATGKRKSIGFKPDAFSVQETMRFMIYNMGILHFVWHNWDRPTDDEE